MLLTREQGVVGERMQHIMGTVHCVSGKELGCRRPSPSPAAPNPLLSLSLPAQSHAGKLSFPFSTPGFGNPHAVQSQRGEEAVHFPDCGEPLGSCSLHALQSCRIWVHRGWIEKKKMRETAEVSGRNLEGCKSELPTPRGCSPAGLTSHTAPKPCWGGRGVSCFGFRLGFLWLQRQSLLGVNRCSSLSFF